MRAGMPGFIKFLFPRRIWNLPREEKVLYLSFDDGPIPEVTPWVLELLEKYDASATFFCIGDNVRKHPEVFRKVMAAGHSTGNHTYHHLKGWRTSAIGYLENIKLAQQEMDRFLEKDAVKARLFRPPYGRMTQKQERLLRNEGFRIIMWDVLSGDYDRGIPEEKCFLNVVRNAQPGSIVVFHDSLKAENNLRKVLPKVLEYYSQKGFTFRDLNSQLTK